MPSDDRPLRVLHWPTDVGGHPSDLAQAERAVGLDSTVAVISRGPFGYPVDIDLNLGSASRVRRLAGRARMLLRASRSYDVVHLNFGQAFLPMLGPLGMDLPLLRAAGVRIFATFQGCDARLPSRCPLCCHGGGPCGLDQVKPRIRIARFVRRWSARTFALNPDLLDTVPDAIFLPYTRVDPRRVEPRFSKPHTGPVRVAHAPTNRKIKGTEAVLNAVRRLGSKVELDLIEGVSNAETIRRLAQADVVIDQLRLGWYGALSVEAMALGKPVISRIDAGQAHRIPGEMFAELPIIAAEQESLSDVLAHLVAGGFGPLHERGQHSRAFVERWHDPIAIAGWLSRVYRRPEIANSGFAPDLARD